MSHLWWDKEKRPPVPDAFRIVTANSTHQMETEKEYSPFDADWAMFWVNFIYEHFDGVKLLICCAKGSVYESFEEDLIQKEAEESGKYANILRDSGRMKKDISDMQWHILATAYIHLIFEVVRHDMTREEATEHTRFVRDLLYPGWRQIYGV